MLRNKGLKVISILVIGVVLSMTLGYSVLVQELEIIGNAQIDAENYLIEIESIEVLSIGNGAYQNATSTFNETEGTMHLGLPNTSSNIIYKIKIKNKGLTSGVLDYTYVSIDNSDIKYKIGGINNKDVIASGESIEVTVEFEYWDNITSVNNTTGSAIIDFEFVPYNNSYSTSCTSNWDGTSSSEPSKKTVYGVEYYQISNGNELKWFTDTVNNGSKNINAILTKDICLNDKTASQIGTSGYEGIFDGQNRTIEGFKVNTGEVEIGKGKSLNYVYGVFNTNNGVIKNLNVNANYYVRTKISPETGVDIHLDNTVGGIVIINNGKISDLSLAGRIETDFELRTNCFTNTPTNNNWVGGIVGVNNGVITGSYNKAVLTSKATNEKDPCTYDGVQKLYLGGITGENNGYISDNYNVSNLTITGNIEKKKCNSYFRIGGLIGSLTSGAIKNSYTSGTISYNVTPEQEYDAVEKSLGGAIGSSSGTVSNVYYLDSAGYAGAGTSTTSNDLTNLNISIGNYYFKDLKTQNGGYPILKWQR